MKKKLYTLHRYAEKKWLLKVYINENKLTEKNAKKLTT